VANLITDWQPIAYVEIKAHGPSCYVVDTAALAFVLRWIIWSI
jgi:hypothetical protein